MKICKLLSYLHNFIVYIVDIQFMATLFRVKITAVCNQFADYSNVSKPSFFFTLPHWVLMNHTSGQIKFLTCSVTANKAAIKLEL